MGGESDEGNDSDYAYIAVGSAIYSSTASTLSIRFLMFHMKHIERRTQMAKFKPSAKLSFGALEHYNPQYLANNYTPSEIRKEYSRIRAIAVKRLTRLAKGGFGETSVYKYNVFNTKKLSELTEKQIPLALSQLARFLDNPLSTVTGQKAQRKQKIEKLQSYGYDVNEKNFQSFVDFMELLSQQAIDLQYDSEAVVELWEATRDKVSPATIAKDLDSWLENRYKISELPNIASKDADEILRLLKE